MATVDCTSSAKYTDKVVLENYKQAKPGAYGNIGAGSDGQITLWKQREHSKLPVKSIAVKTPQRRLEYTIRREIENLKAVGNHPNIVRMLGYTSSQGGWIYPRGPAIFMEYYELGNLNHFRNRWRKQGFNSVFEETVWKLLLDMARGLDHIHNKLGETYVHHDFKPCNILVSAPHWIIDDPEQPIINPTFKIADIARLFSYSPETKKNYNGTPEFAPPLEERVEFGPTPASDMFGLGATIQKFALGCEPVMNRDEWKREMIKRGEQIPQELDKIRNAIPVVVRNINMPRYRQKQLWNVKEEQEPYSNALDKWYTNCLEMDREKRATSQLLDAHFVQQAEQHIKYLVEQRIVRASQVEEKKTAELLHDFRKSHAHRHTRITQKGPRNGAKVRDDKPAQLDGRHSQMASIVKAEIKNQQKVSPVWIEYP